MLFASFGFLATVLTTSGHHSPAFYNFQSKLLPDSISGGQIIKNFSGGMPLDPLAEHALHNKHFIWAYI